MVEDGGRRNELGSFGSVDRYAGKTKGIFEDSLSSRASFGYTRVLANRQIRQTYENVARQ